MGVVVQGWRGAREGGGRGLVAWHRPTNLDKANEDRREIRSTDWHTTENRTSCNMRLVRVLFSSSRSRVNTSVHVFATAVQENT